MRLLGCNAKDEKDQDPPRSLIHPGDEYQKPHRYDEEEKRECEGKTMVLCI